MKVRINVARYTRLVIAVLLGLLIWKWYYNGMPIPSVKDFHKLTTKIENFLARKPNYTGYFPKIKEEWKSGKHVPYQWESKDGFYAIVALDNLEVLKKPNRKGSVVTKLHKAERVRVIYRQTKKDIYKDEDGHWVFITTEDGKHTVGWVFDYFLAFSNKFQKITEWEIASFSFMKGDYVANFQTQENGKFTCQWRASGNGIYLRSKYTGQLYRYGNIIWAKKDTPDSWNDFFYLNNEDKLELKYRNSACEASKPKVYNDYYE